MLVEQDTVTLSANRVLLGRVGEEIPRRKIPKTGSTTGDGGSSSVRPPSSVGKTLNLEDFQPSTRRMWTEAISILLIRGIRMHRCKPRHLLN